MKKLCLTVLITFLVSFQSMALAKHLRLRHPDWAPDVKQAVNDFLDCYGVDSPNYRKDSYVVFDFDNTTAIYDIEYQTFIHRVKAMAYNFTPEQFQYALLYDMAIPDKVFDLTAKNLGKGSLRQRVEDLAADYAYLWKKYGPFTYKGLSEKQQKLLHQDQRWQDFAAKMGAYKDFTGGYIPRGDIGLHNIISDMSTSEVYTLVYDIMNKYSKTKTAKVHWETANHKLGSGKLVYEEQDGITVTPNNKELWAALQDNGIDVWVCSASCIDEIRGAVDALGLHKYCKGAIAMTPKVNNEKIELGYDWDTGYGYYCLPNGKWAKMSRPTKAFPAGPGKVDGITNAIAPDYGNHGPLAGFMDSSGDFNFCTEYNTLKLVICYNRADRKVTDGGGLVSALAIYQRDGLGYDLRKANANGDTLYVLQGRDVRGLRKFRPYNCSYVLGVAEPRLFASEQNWQQLLYMIRNKMTTAQALNTFAMKTDAKKSPLGFKYGFLTEYSGYHSKD